MKFKDYLYYSENGIRLYNADCLDVMRKLPDDYVDLVVTDPPYFLTNKSGSGFMGKSWDSIHTLWRYLWLENTFVNFVEKFLKEVRIEENMEEVNTAQENANITEYQSEKVRKSNVQFAPKDLEYIGALKKDFAQILVLTKQGVLDLLKELLPKGIKLKFLSGVSENAKFAIPISLLKKELVNTAAGTVLKLLIKKICEAKKIQLTLMDAVRIKNVFEGMIGKKSVSESIREINLVANYVARNAKEERFSVTILNLIKKEEVTKILTLLLYAMSVMSEQNLAKRLIRNFFKQIGKECLRILKPGAFAFIMTTSRQDSLTETIMGLQEAGFETGFSSIYWTYASGFPKASNIGKMIDKRLGKKRKVIGKSPNDRQKSQVASGMGFDRALDKGQKHKDILITEATSSQAKELDGSYSGFQPKPAVEIIIVAMKPISEKTYVDQALKNKHGITWLDNCRVPHKEPLKETNRKKDMGQSWNSKNCGLRSNPTNIASASPKGRFPANLLVSNDILNDGKISKTHSTGKKGITTNCGKGFYKVKVKNIKFEESGGSYSRYFDLDKWWIERVEKLPKSVKKVFPFLIVPKASKREKNQGCENLENKDGGHFAQDEWSRKNMGNCPDDKRKPVKNNHPTVKPLALFSYLITLGSRENDVILDPFAGSGTTLIASKILNRKGIGIEKNKEYCLIAKHRMKGN